MIAKSATTAATLNSFKSFVSPSHNNNNNNNNNATIDKVEKLQNVVRTGIFRPKTEFSRTSILMEQLTKSGRTTKFRTDILIEELEKLIKDLQEFLKIRLSSNQYDNTYGPDSIIEMKKKLDLNIVKYEIVQKLNIELNFARSALEEAIRDQGDVGVARKRAAWLEEKIESIILSQNEILFPMQTQLMSDKTLRIKRVGKPLADKTETSSISNRDQNNKSRSSDSTFAALQYDVPEDIKDSFARFRMRNNSVSENRQDLEKPSSAYSNDYPNSESASETKSKRAVSISDAEIARFEFDDGDQIYTDEIINERISEILKDKKTEDGIIDLPHRRFEWSPFVKLLYKLDPTTFHQLGISVRDSYIENVDELDTELPWLTNKEDLDTEDLYLQRLYATKIETLYKKICQSSIESTLPHKVTSYTPVIIPSVKEPVSVRAKRLMKSFKKPGEDENSLPKKDDVRLGSTMSHSYVFYPHPITPINPLPLQRTNTSVSYPRSPKVYADLSASGSFHAPRRLVNQRNLKEESRLNLYNPKTILNSNSITIDPTVVISESARLTKQDFSKRTSTHQNLASRVSEATQWRNLKPKSSAVYHDGLKFERIRDILSTNLRSSSFDEKLDAIRHLGLLRAADSAVLFTLQTMLDNKDEDEILRLECAKSLVLLGFWRENIFKYMVKYLSGSTVDIQINLLKTIISGKNVNYIERTTHGFDSFYKVLESLTDHRDETVSLNASICLGKLGIMDSFGAQNKLRNLIETNTDWVKKTIALEVYVMQFENKSEETLYYALDQLKGAPMWPSRAAAARLLCELGTQICCTRENIEDVYNSLEDRLCNDPIKEVRVIIKDTFKSLQLYNRAIQRMAKNLESEDEETRAKAVMAIDILAVKKGKVIQLLVEMLELDGSDHVRVLIIKTLLHLVPNDHKVKIAFDQLEKSSHLNVIIKKLKNEAATKSASDKKFKLRL